MLVQHVFLDNQLNKMKRTVETDSGDDCTTLQMHSIPLNCKLQDREDGKFYVMWEVREREKEGGRKAEQSMITE